MKQSVRTSGHERGRCSAGTRDRDVQFRKFLRFERLIGFAGADAVVVGRFVAISVELLLMGPQRRLGIEPLGHEFDLGSGAAHRINALQQIPGIVQLLDIETPVGN